MESKNLNIIVDKKIVKAWRGYGYFISFDFGKTIKKTGLNKVGETIEVNHPEISLSIEDAWGFVKNGQNIIGTDLSTDSREQNIELFSKVDKFLEENFKQNEVIVENFEIQENITIITFSNGLELEMNNHGSRTDDSDNWYLLVDDSISK